ncbi:MAG: gliding motility-associated protein GldE [Bacteroidales bacterium]
MDPDPLSYFYPQLSGILLFLQQIEVNPLSTGSCVALVLTMLALFFSAFISGSELAFFSITNEQLESIENNPRSKDISLLLDAPERLLATLLIANNLVNVTIVILCNHVMTEAFVFQNSVLNFVVQTIILTFLILLFGEIIPKLYASNNNLKFALFSFTTINMLSKLFSPISRLMVKSSFIVDKIVTKKRADLSVEDLSHALEISDVHAGEEKDMLEGILKFGATTVTEIMTPRMDVKDINIDSDFSKVIEVILETGYSRLPVYEQSRDNIKGVLYAKDLLPYIGKENSSDFQWQSLLRNAYFVPEARMIDDLLEDFRGKHIHMAVVVDEFGCIQGIVTLEDIIEEIVGDINDEYDVEEKYHQKLKDNSYIFDGKIQLNDFFKITSLDEADFVQVTEDVDTLAGLLLTIKGDFPAVKESIRYGRCQFLILEVKRYRISRVKLKILTDDELTANDET